MSITKQDSLKEKILHLVHKGDIAGLYMLEQEVSESFDEANVINYYKNILDLALEKLTDTLEAKTQFDLSDVQSFATIRALYEYAMEHYHAGKLEDASALFEILSGITSDTKFSTAMQKHTQAARSGIELDSFLEEYADMEAVQKEGNFYISAFAKEIKEANK